MAVNITFSPGNSSSGNPSLYKLNYRSVDTVSSNQTSNVYTLTNNESSQVVVQFGEFSGIQLYSTSNQLLSGTSMTVSPGQSILFKVVVPSALINSTIASSQNRRISIPITVSVGGQAPGGTGGSASNRTDVFYDMEIDIKSNTDSGFARKGSGTYQFTDTINEYLVKVSLFKTTIQFENGVQKSTSRSPATDIAASSVVSMVEYDPYFVKVTPPTELGNGAVSFKVSHLLDSDKTSTIAKINVDGTLTGPSNNILQSTISFGDVSIRTRPSTLEAKLVRTDVYEVSLSAFYSTTGQSKYVEFPTTALSVLDISSVANTTITRLGKKTGDPTVEMVSIVQTDKSRSASIKFHMNSFILSGDTIESAETRINLPSITVDNIKSLGVGETLGIRLNKDELTGRQSKSIGGATYYSVPFTIDSISAMVNSNTVTMSSQSQINDFVSKYLTGAKIMMKSEYGRSYVQIGNETPRLAALSYDISKGLPTTGIWWVPDELPPQDDGSGDKQYSWSISLLLEGDNVTTAVSPSIVKYVVVEQSRSTTNSGGPGGDSGSTSGGGTGAGGGDTGTEEETGLSDDRQRQT